MKYILDVSKWRCGEGDEKENKTNNLGFGQTELLNDEGYMCCLGQFAKQVGVSDSSLKGNAVPSDVGFVYDETFVEEIVTGYKDKSLANILMNINDNEDTSIEEKIQLIKEELEECGHSLKVVNLEYLNK